MKTPRFEDFPSMNEPEQPIKPLHSPLDGMPQITSPSKKSQTVYKSTSPHADNTVSPVVNDKVSKRDNSKTKRFTTYYTAESIKKMQLLALQTDKNDYELFQEAVNDFLKKMGY